MTNFENKCENELSRLKITHDLETKTLQLDYERKEE